MPSSNARGWFATGGGSALWFGICVVALLAAGLAVRMSIATADYRSLIALDVYQDDAFYYFKIAQNIVDGRGMTFDGTTTTNGFHPLYMALLLPVMAWAGDDLVAPIPASGILLAFVGVVAGWLTYRLTLRLAGRLAALAALAIFAFSPYFAVFGVNGLETGLALLFAVAVPSAYVAWVRQPGGHTGRLGACGLGVVCGLAVLARLDLSLLAVAVGLDWVFASRRRGDLGHELPRMALAAGLALAVWLPWGLTSRIATGDWLPSSGSASRTIALNYGWKNLQPIWSAARLQAPGASQYFDPDAVPAVYHADVATQQALIFLFEQPLLAPLRVHLPASVWPRLDRYLPYALFRSSPWGALAGAVVLAALGAWAFVRLRRAGPRPGPQPGLGTLVGVYLALTFLGYTFYCPAHWYYPRYLAPAVLLTTVWGLAQARVLLLPLWRRGSAARAAVALGLLLVVSAQLAISRGSTLAQLRQHDGRPGGFLRAWLVLGDRIDPDRGLAAFQAGNFSYWGRRDVINLDGKVNPEARKALAHKDLARYIAERPIDYILDWPWVVGSLCVRHMQPGQLVLHEIAREPGGYGFVLFGVARP